MTSADTLGRFLVLHGTRFSGRIGAHGGRYSYGRSDSAAVILVNRNDVSADTVGRIRGPYTGTNNVRARVDGMNITYMLGNPLGVGDQALLFPDGWIATVYVEPYRVEWRSQNGAVVRGQSLPHTPQPLNDRLKQLAVDDRWHRPGSTAPKFRLDDFPAWPAVLPPFLKDALLALPDGKIAIIRTALGGQPRQYDIVDRQGKLSGVLRLPPNERVMGFGARSVYVVATDSDGLETLRRHPWP